MPLHLPRGTPAANLWIGCPAPQVNAEFVTERLGVAIFMLIGVKFICGASTFTLGAVMLADADPSIPTPIVPPTDTLGVAIFTLTDGILIFKSSTFTVQHAIDDLSVFYMSIEMS